MTSAGVARAELPRAVLESLSAAPPPGARLDLNLVAPDSRGKTRSIGQILGGKPGFVSFVDYTCNTLCGTDLMLLSDGIQRAGLKPGDIRILVIGIDPKDSAEAAQAMEKAEIPPALQGAATFLLPRPTEIARATAALGFKYAYDRAADQFAHPAVVYAVGPDGTIRAALSPLALTAGDLRQALQPRAPSLLRRISALCYAYDPLTGAYNLRVTLLLRLAAIAGMAGLGLGLFLLHRKRRWAG